MSCQYMTDRLIEVIRELRDYLGPEAHGLPDADVVHIVMCKALDYQLQLSELKPTEPYHHPQQLKSLETRLCECDSTPRQPDGPPRTYAR